METLRAELQDYARDEARTVEELIAFVEASIERLRPALAEEELAFQRGYKWRPFLAPCALSPVPAYAPKHRTRILPDAYRDRVYVRANLQWLPTILVDGLVAGTWSIAAGRREATLTLQPFARLSAAVRRALVEEAERLVRFAR